MWNSRAPKFSGTLDHDLGWWARWFSPGSPAGVRKAARNDSSLAINLRSFAIGLGSVLLIALGWGLIGEYVAARGSNTTEPAAPRIHVSADNTSVTTYEIGAAPAPKTKKDFGQVLDLGSTEIDPPSSATDAEVMPQPIQVAPAVVEPEVPVVAPKAATTRSYEASIAPAINAKPLATSTAQNAADEDRELFRPLARPAALGSPAAAMVIAAKVPSTIVGNAGRTAGWPVSSSARSGFSAARLRAEIAQRYQLKSGQAGHCGTFFYRDATNGKCVDARDRSNDPN